MSDSVRDSPAASASVTSYDAERLRKRLGPAEAQYGDQVIVASMEGAQGQVACGTTIVDGDPNDTEAGAGTVGVGFVWTDINGETGYRWQFDLDSSSYVSEDASDEVSANNLGPSYLSTGFGTSPGSTSHTFRVFGHVGHAPGHGPTPIAGDVVSNECTVTFVAPGVPQAPTD